MDRRTIVLISRTHSIPWVLQVSKPGTNTFRLSTQVTAMRALVKVLNFVVLAGSKKRTAAHGLRTVVRRSNALIGNIRRSSETEGTKNTLIFCPLRPRSCVECCLLRRSIASLPLEARGRQFSPCYRRE